MGDHVAQLHRVVAQRHLRGLERLGAGLEFVVYRAVDPDGLPVVLRMPRGARYQSNANDPHVDMNALVHWEYQVTQHLTRYGFAVAEPRELVPDVASTGTDADVLISTYVSDDGSGCDSTRLGTLLAALHRIPPGTLWPVAQEGLPTNQLLPLRIVRRYRELAALIPSLPVAPSESQLAALLSGRPAGSLLHLDVRGENLRCVAGAVHALVDWSNSLIGEPALELGRLTEFARLPDNGVDISAVRDGYRRATGQWPLTDQPHCLVYQFDAAVMLAVVFLSEMPDPARGDHAVDRMLQLRYELENRRS